MEFTVIEHNENNPQGLLREMTSEEITELKKAQKKAQEDANRTISLQETRQSALAKLAALGLTEDEIAAL